MQIQKEEIRKRITDAALNEFCERGYQSVTMRNIAQKAEITAGNIYAYFPNKEALLQYLLEEAVATLKEVINDTIPKGSAPLNLEEYSCSLVKKYTRVRKQFLLLINGCKGSNFESVKASLIELAGQRIIEESSEIRISRNVAEAIAVALVNGIIYIFVQYSHDTKLFRSTLTEYMKFMIGNLFPSS